MLTKTEYTEHNNPNRSIRVGDSFDQETKLGPVVSKQHLEKIRSYIEIARKTGSVEYLDCGSSKADPNGYFTGLAIVTDVTADSPCMQEEIFGPVVCIVKFKNEDEAVDIANSTDFGLSASVWTESVNRMHRVAHRIQAGTVWGNCWLVRNLNMPFGGVKESGVGRESTLDSRNFYTNKKTVCISIKK